MNFFPAVEQFLLFNFCNFTILPHVQLRFQVARGFADLRSDAEGRPMSIFTFSELPDVEVTNFRSHFALNSNLMEILFTGFAIYFTWKHCVTNGNTDFSSVART